MEEEGKVGRGNENHCLATDRGLFWWDLFLGTQKLSVFFSIYVSVLEQPSERRKLAKQVSVWPQRWTLLVTETAALRE